jgi:hypothetical protein
MSMWLNSSRKVAHFVTKRVDGRLRGYRIVQEWVRQNSLMMMPGSCGNVRGKQAMTGR